MSDLDEFNELHIRVLELVRPYLVLDEHVKGCFDALRDEGFDSLNSLRGVSEFLVILVQNLVEKLVNPTHILNQDVIAGDNHLLLLLSFHGSLSLISC